MGEALTLRDIRIWDGVGEDYSDHDAIRIEDGRIAGVGAARDLGAGARIVDAGGLTAVPGLIDAHVHLCLDPEIRDPEAQPRGDPLRDPMRARAEAMVRAGITTARDLGGGDWIELDIREEIRRGALRGPRLLCAGQPVTTPRGHCHFWGGGADGLEQALEVIERQLERGADLLKIMATGGNLTPGSRPVDAQFDALTLSAMVDRAARAGKPVAAHCHGTAGIRNAVTAGVHTIEHCSWVGPCGWGADYDEVTARAIAAAEIWVSPTVNDGWARHIGGGDYQSRVRANFQRMSSAGVRFIASTDAGIPGVRHHRLAHALPVFAHFAGKSPHAVLRAATSDGACALGLGHLTGRIAPGLAADLLLVEDDPLADLTVLTAPVEVFAAGRPTLQTIA